MKLLAFNEPVFAMFSIFQVLFGLVLGIVLLGIFCALTVVALVAALKGWSRVLWATVAAMVGLVSAVIFVHPGGIWLPTEYPYLTKAPVEADLIGTYVLTKNSATRVTRTGYTNLNAMIELKNDHTFEIKDMPHLWLYGSEYRAGYDACWGTWKAAPPHGTKIYKLLGPIKGFATNSAFITDPDKGVGNQSFIRFGIAAKTRKRPSYALAVPLFNEDSGFLIFEKGRIPAESQANRVKSN